METNLALGPKGFYYFILSSLKLSQSRETCLIGLKFYWRTGEVSLVMIWPMNGKADTVH